MKSSPSPAGFRKLIGLSQKELADIFGISVQSVSRKEKGRTPYTDKEKLVLRDLIRKGAIPDITIDTIFFEKQCHKVSFCVKGGE